MGKSKTKSFQTETKQLLQLMIYSLYSNKEIFLRELISNASDALDKLRFKSISSSKLASLSDDLKIKVIVDEENKTLTISDNGIGMSEEEIIENIGTIARSGTAEFLGKLTGDKKKDSFLDKLMRNLPKLPNSLMPNLSNKFGSLFSSKQQIQERKQIMSKIDEGYLNLLKEINTTKKRFENNKKFEEAEKKIMTEFKKKRFFGN